MENKKENTFEMLRNEYRSIPGREMFWGILENATYGFLGATLIVFISTGIDIAVLFSYLCYYFFLGKVVNRPKYVTHIGRFIIFPVPTALGAFTGYKLSKILSLFLL